MRSFKAISGNIALPQFAIEGDTVKVIGKALNYTADSITAQRLFYVNDKLIKETSIQFRNAWIDSFAIATTSGDSLKLKYTVQRGNGYFDGEERSIPLFKKGVLEAKGFFNALHGDTSFIITPQSDTATVKIYAETSVLPSLEKEVENLRNYEYLCNEQLASKLKGLLVQKKIDTYLKRPFKYNKAVNDILLKLIQGKNNTGLWGWWAGNESAMWISLHALEALLQAKAESYTVSLNNSSLIDYLIFNYENYPVTEQITVLHLLHLLDAKAAYQRYADSLSQQIKTMSLYEKLRLVELKQKAGLENSLDSLVAKQSRTMLGNTYWGEEGYRFFDNSVQNTIMMYRLLKAKGGYNDLLQKMRGYFLERRRASYWRNTYESSLILETILPDLLVNDSFAKPSSITINGSETISRFPFSKELKGGSAITVSKQGAWPVYFTAYEQYWNAAPQKVESDFVVHSSFEKGGETVIKLKGGGPVLLEVAVSVKADANYVMVEVPIPAGCSYQDKKQTYLNNEVHREYFKNKVSIFCSTLKKGDYTFTISLLPRYSGSYTINPAKAELMYFPTFYGREAMKKIHIQ